jgi:RHS repeat-associated protein
MRSLSRSAQSLRAALFLTGLFVAGAAAAFQPSPTSPYNYSTEFSDADDHYIVGDGFFHDPGCTAGGPPDYSCFCGIGAPGRLTPPVLTHNGNTIDVEYWILNAYCNPAGGNPNRPNSQNYYIDIYSIDGNDAVSGPIHIIAPYWEHGKVTLGASGCLRYIAVLRINYFGCGSFCFEFAASKVGGPTGQDANGRSCLDETRSCPVPISAAKPINVASGNLRYSETLFAVAENASPLAFTLTYNSRVTTATAVGVGFTHPFAATLIAVSSSPHLLRYVNGSGEKTMFFSSDAANYVPVWPADATGSVTFDPGASTYTLTDLEGTLTVFGSADGHWISTTDRWGNAFTSVYSSGNLTTITDPVSRSWTLGYSGSQLISITNPAGSLWQFGYDGSGHLSKIADPFHPLATPWRTYAYVQGSAAEPTVLATVSDDAGFVLEGHQFDTAGRAMSSWSGDTVGSPPAPGPNARSKVTLTYLSGTQTSVNSFIDTAFMQAIFTFSAPLGRFLPSSIVGNCPSCSGGEDDAQSFTWDSSNHMRSRVAGIDKSTQGGVDERVETDYTYDGNGLILSKTEAVGKTETRATTFTYGYVSPLGLAWPRFVTSKTEPSAAKPGASNHKVTAYSWNGSGTPETTLTTHVSGFLKSSDASPTVYTTTTLFDPSHRIIEVDGPAANEKATSTYYGNGDATANRRGRLQTTSVYTASATHLDTTFDNYDLFGTAKKVVDPNGVETDRTTDAMGRVLTVVSTKPASDPNEPANYTTTYTFDTRDRLMDATLPVGNKLHYDYEDGTNRLLDTVQVDTTGKQQSRMLLTLNIIGDKTKEEAQSCNTPAAGCAAWTTKRNESFKYDAHNRLSEIDHPTPSGSKSLYVYDSRGNLTGIQDERHTAVNTIYAYDFLNRLKTVTQKQTIAPGPDIVTQYGYDIHDNVISVTDPNGNVTTYAPDDFRRVQTQTSPVSGTTNYSYDPAGNLLTATDANAATTTRVFDAANRIISATSVKSGSATETVTYTYDDPTAGSYGLGRLTSMTDPVGSASYAYERRGLLRSETKTISSTAFPSAYAYDKNGNRKTVTYPSGRSVAYTFDFADRPKTAKMGTTTYVSSATYAPFGPETKIVYGNGTTKTVTVDQRYRIKTNKLTNGAATLASYSYTPDALGNITQIADLNDATFNRDFAYDDLNRLTAANSGTNLWGTAAGNGYTYDKMGNMLTLTLGTARTASFSYSGIKPKLTSVTESDLGTRAVTYDAAGNEKKIGTAPNQTYSTRNYLKMADSLTFGYDGQGLRTTVTQGTNKRYFFYTPEMSLLAESTLAPSPIAVGGYDQIWFNGHPVAEEDGGTHWTFTDHLGTPLMQTDSTGMLPAYWRAEYEPYGRVFKLRTGNQHAPLRLPGQESEELNVSGDGNGTTERFYNIFRWYRPRWGRYTQADPLESAANPHPFSYSMSSPLRVIDPLGLFNEIDRFTVAYLPHLHPPICPEGAGGACTTNAYAYLYCECDECPPVKAHPTLVLSGNIKVFSGNFRNFPLRPAVDRTVVDAASAIAHEHLFHLDHGVAIARHLAGALDLATFESHESCTNACALIGEEITKAFQAQLKASKLGEEALRGR